MSFKQVFSARRESLRAVSKASLVFVISLAVYWLIASGPTPFYEPAVQANAFLHGHAWVDDAPGFMEVSRYSPPKASLMHPPLSGVVMMPVVWWMGGVSGADRYQPKVCVVLGAIGVTLAYWLVRSWWLTLFFALGSTFGYEASLGAGWDFVLVVSTIPTLLALNEAYGKKRPFLLGLWGGLAVTARYDLIFALPFYLWMTKKNSHGH